MDLKYLVLLNVNEVERMEFLQIARMRQSCRHYDESRKVETEKTISVLEAARLAPSACNGQPYHFTVCQDDAARAEIGRAHV